MVSWIMGRLHGHSRPPLDARLRGLMLKFTMLLLVNGQRLDYPGGASIAFVFKRILEADTHTYSRSVIKTEVILLRPPDFPSEA